MLLLRGMGPPGHSIEADNGQFTQFIELFAQPRLQDTINWQFTPEQTPPKIQRILTIHSTNKHGQLLIHWGHLSPYNPNIIGLKVTICAHASGVTCVIRRAHHQHFWTSLLCTLNCLRELLKKSVWLDVLSSSEDQCRGLVKVQSIGVFFTCFTFIKFFKSTIRATVSAWMSGLKFTGLSFLMSIVIGAYFISSQSE